MDDIKSFEITPGRHLAPEKLTSHLLPPEWLDTAIPFFYDQFKKDRALRFVDPDAFKLQYEKRLARGEVIPTWQSVLEDTSRPNFGTVFFKKFPELKPFEEDFLLRPYGNYVEGVYFGEMKAQGNVKALIYRSNPPTADELKRFEALGIQVIDGRK